MREYPRYEINTRAHVEAQSRNFEIRVYDISESGTLIEAIPRLGVGTPLVLTFPGLHPVKGKIIRAVEDTMGVCFEPQKLKTEEVRRLITAVA